MRKAHDMMRGFCACLLACVACLPAHARENKQTDPRVAAFVAQDATSNLQLSPDGMHVAGVLHGATYTGLAVFDRKSGQLQSSMRFPEGNQVVALWWANNRRLLVSLGQNFGNDAPSPTGELFAIDMEGTNHGMLAGYRVRGPTRGNEAGNAAQQELSMVFPLGRIPGNERDMLVEVWPLDEKHPDARVDRMDVFSGARTEYARAPVPRASFTLDNQARVRFARSSDEDNHSRLFYRGANSETWTLINDEGVSQHIETPLGFSADNRIAYLQSEQASGADVVVAFDTQTGTRKVVASHPVCNPLPIHRDGGRELIGVRYPDPDAAPVYFEPESAAAVEHARLRRSFPRGHFDVRSASDDGKVKLLAYMSDRDPGSYYIFDAASGKASFYQAARRSIDVQAMSETRIFDFNARDGMRLHGLLTLPTSKAATLPLVVMPHGGPFGIQDVWGFDTDAQLLSAAGYAVLQVNFRGSGGFGRAYKRAGMRQWGKAMQDDLTDATRWVVAQGGVDPARICIYGASYGGYAALMGVVREPALYRCAVGSVGVYDLNKWTKTDWRTGKDTKDWFRDWVGERGDGLAAVSPVTLARNIQAPVLLTWGWQDDVAPAMQSRAMVERLRSAGKQVDTLSFRYEGHGLYVSAHQAEFYSRLLAFLDEHIGKQTTSGAYP